MHKSDIPTIPSRVHTTNSNFKHYISQLDPWETELLHDLHFQCAFDEFRVALSTQIIVASDGSVVNNRGSFGWVISTTNGTLLATGSGIAFGYNITSFRCEAYGILAPLRLLYHYQRFNYSTHNQRSITWYCDSESLLKRVHNNLHDTTNPNRYKLADNDLEVAIVSTIPLVCTAMQRHHIRSHQNDHIALHRLPMPQRLNRMADSLAADAHTAHNSPSHNVPLISLAGCQLQTKAGTITRAYTRTLHEAFTYQQTTKHICHRLGIHQTRMHSIAWSPFNQAFQSLPLGSQRIIRRWMFGYLPTQRRLTRYKQSSSPLCPICHLHDETDEHFLTCGGSSSWKSTLFTPLEQLSHKHQLPSVLESYIRQQFQLVLDNPRHLMQPQADLPGLAIFSGIFHLEWITFLKVHLPSRGPSLLTKVIRIIFHAVASRWTTRSTTLHSQHKQTPETRDRLQHQIRILYSCRANVLTQDQHIFKIPLSEITQKPTAYLKMFLHQYKALIKRSIRLRQAETARQHRDIATYFIRHNRGSL